MKFGADNKWVTLAGVALALAAVTIGATVAKEQMAMLAGLAGAALGAVGIQFGGKPGDQ